MKKHPAISQLMQKGFTLLNRRCHKDAITIGRQLKKLRHSSAFEIMALAYQQEGKLTSAIAVLEEGVSKAGRVWVLWELLGNCYSGAGRFADAERAYQEALGRDACNQDVVHLNRAIALLRARKPDEALGALRRVTGRRLFRRAQACRVRALMELGRKRLALRLATELCTRRPVSVENYDQETEAEILVACAAALSEHPSTRLKARRLAIRGIGLSPSNQEALAIVRETALKNAAALSFFRCIVQGTWHGPMGKSHFPPGFFRSCEIAAPSEDKILAYVKPFFPATVRKSLEIEDVKQVEKSTSRRAGVYFLSGYMCFPRRKTR